MTRQDLRKAGWTRVIKRYTSLELWKHREVRDGYLHTFEEAVMAQGIRAKRNGGA